MAYFRCGAPVEGIARLSGHLDSLAPIDDHRRRGGRAGLQLALARLYYANGQYRECRAAAERGAAQCRADDDVRLLAEIELWRGIGLLWSDAPDGGVTALTHALGLADSHHAADIPTEYFTPLPSAYLGLLRLDEGRLEEAHELLTHAADQAQEAGNREVLGYAHTQLLRLDLRRGRAAGVIDRLGLDPDLTGVTFWYDVILLTVLATALLETGRPSEAEMVGDRAVERARLMRNRIDGVAALGIRAACRSRLGRDEEAAQDRAEASSWLVRLRA